MHRGTLLAGLVLAAAVALAGLPAVAGASEHTDVVVDYELGLLPDQPGEIQVRAVVRLDDRITGFEFTPPRRATVTDLHGFTEGDKNGDYAWDEATREPAVTYRLAINTTDAADGQSHTVDTGSWALVENSRTTGRFSWSWRTGADPTWSQTHSLADGQTGHVDDALSLLGETTRTTYERSAVTVAVIGLEGRTTTVDPERGADIVAATKAALDVGGEDETVTVYAVPGTPLYYAYAAEGEAAEIVFSNETRRAWYHEYVHTVQDYRTAENASWFDEGSALFYEVLVATQHGDASSEAFPTVVTSDDYADEDLTAPDTWSEPRVPYAKGAHVIAVIDARIRNESGGTRSMQDVFFRLNAHDGTVTHEVFVDAVSAVADAPLAAFVEAEVRGDGDGTAPTDPYVYLSDASGNEDRDGDGLTDREEVDEYETDPLVADTDGDGLDDGAEVNEYDTDPLVVDTDDDGLDDGAEVNEYDTDPLVADTDGDGMADGSEVATDGRDPLTADARTPTPTTTDGGEGATTTAVTPASTTAETGDTGGSGATGPTVLAPLLALVAVLALVVQVRRLA
jgi:hypothetical protein